MRSILSFIVRFVAVNAPNSNTSTFGGLDPGDDTAALLDVARKPVSQFASDGTVREFDFRQYLFARQALVRKLYISLMWCIHLQRHPHFNECGYQAVSLQLFDFCRNVR